MNHYFNTSGAQVALIQTFTLIFLLFSSLFISVAIEKKLNVSENITKIITVITVLAIMLFVFGGSRLIRDHFNYGNIKKLYIVNTKAGPRLAVLFSREEHRRFGIFHTPRIATYDLNQGTLIGSIWPSNKNPADHYLIYGPFGQKAWGYSYRPGIVLLDLATPKVLAGRKEILARNPQLGGSYKKVFSDYLYDPVTHSIQVMNPKGQYFRINPDLKAIRINTYAARRNPRGWAINLRHLSDKDKNEKVIATLSKDKEKWVFVSRGGYTLATIRKDAVTGKILGRIDYLK